MWRKLLTLALMLGVGIPALAGTSAPRRGAVAGSSAFNDITFWLNFDNGAPTTPYVTDPYTINTSGTYKEYSAGDTTGTYSSAPSASDPGSYVKTGAAKVGSYGLHVQNDTAGMSMFFAAGDGANEQIAFHSAGALGYWWLPSGSCGVVNVLGIGNNTNGKLSIACNGNNLNLTMYDPSGPTTVTTSDIAFSLGSWIFVMARWNDAGNTINLSVWNGTSTTTVSSSTAWTSPGTWATNFVEFGVLGNQPSGDVYIDNLMISNSSTRNFITDLGPDGTTPLMNYASSPR